MKIKSKTKLSCLEHFLIFQENYLSSSNSDLLIKIHLKTVADEINDSYDQLFIKSMFHISYFNAWSENWVKIKIINLLKVRKNIAKVHQGECNCYWDGM